MGTEDYVTVPTRSSTVLERDVLLFFGVPYKLNVIKPYTHPGVTKGEPGWRTAATGTTPAAWGSTLEPQVSYDIVVLR